MSATWSGVGLADHMATPDLQERQLGVWVTIDNPPPVDLTNPPIDLLTWPPSTYRVLFQCDWEEDVYSNELTY